MSDTFEQTCDYCGAKFRVDVPHQEGHDSLEEYYCPDCHKEFKTRAAYTPTVTRISGRTDGRTDQYDNRA
ncbi:hypothetical protein ABU614_15850 [Lysobacter firmicutimachus]|uniref:Zinc ribbon domain-containing protein n=1 Tax=Lysobacter firmicutimachus TaxID=1792846 RepID=A0AAU8MQG7_9GAMM|nr:hypothetical protein [Lysobacter antibioticus]